MPYREQYFDNFLLKASVYGKFNDPFDLELGCYASSLSTEDKMKFYEAMPEHFNSIDTILEIQTGARASLAVLCFTTEFKNILMWSHYANNHEGVCIGYDYNSDFFHGRFNCSYSSNVGKITSVRYTNNRPSYITLSDLINDTTEWFTKSKDWKYEKEERILLPVDSAKNHADIGLLYEIEHKHIKQVILGCRMSSENKQCIINKLSGLDIEIIEAGPHPSHYKLNFLSVVN